jgi:hypothetical protein
VIFKTSETAKEANPGKGASFNPINSILESTAREDYRIRLIIAN